MAGQVWLSEASSSQMLCLHRSRGEEVVCLIAEVSTKHIAGDPTEEGTAAAHEGLF